MSEIPEMKCPQCGTPMEYCGGPSDSNIFIMRCTREGGRYQGTYYAEAPINIDVGKGREFPARKQA